MLSSSCQQIDAEFDLGAIAAGSGDAGIALGAELLRFATAAASVRGDGTELNDARRALVSVSSEALMIDAAAVAANFQMMTRLADGTGARHPAARLEGMVAMIEAVDAGSMDSRR